MQYWPNKHIYMYFTGFEKNSSNLITVYPYKDRHSSRILIPAHLFVYKQKSFLK